MNISLILLSYVHSPQPNDELSSEEAVQQLFRNRSREGSIEGKGYTGQSGHNCWARHHGLLCLFLVAKVEKRRSEVDGKDFVPKI